jgi:chondroitin AC lyase
MHRLPRFFLPAYLAVMLSTVAFAATPGERDLQILRQRIFDSVRGSVSPDQAAKLLSSMRPDGGFPNVPYDDAGPGNWRAAAHLSQTLTLARRYVALENNSPEKTRLRDALFRALDFWQGRDPRNSNWWWNVIGVPGTLSQIYILLDGELEGSRRQKGLEIIARGKLSMTGANLADVVNITLRRGVVERDIALVSKAVGMMADEIRISLEEGIQPDFSFHQHGALLYNHGYGAVFLSNCSELANLVTGTAFEFPREKIDLLSRMILEGNQWMVRYGTKDMGATGRGISRPSGASPSAGYLVPIVREMLTLNTGRDPEFRSLLSRLEGNPGVPLVGNRHYRRGDYMAHHRAGYFVSARMFSDRLFNTDGPSNQEGLKSYHLSDGCTYIMRTGWEYHDIFPVWDWQKIPGTTVQITPELTGRVNFKGTRSFAGGVSDGRYGCAAFDMERNGLFARKSWFFFDDEFVCLGAGIRCETPHPVVTTLNQCFLKGEVLVSRGGQAQKLSPGNRTLDTVSWVYHDSVAYVFPEPQRISLANEPRTGSWWEINHIHSKDPVTKDVFTLWLDHRASPKSDTYVYIVAPAFDPAQAEAYRKKLPVEIIANEPNLQAVRHTGLGVSGIVFYTPGTLALGNGLTIEADQPCLLLVREEGRMLEISASNPENKGMRLTVRIESGTGKTSETVLFDLPDGEYAGMSVTRMIAK